MSSIAEHYDYRERKIAARAMREFARMLRNDRMIALVGSMATESLGYHSWDDLAEKIGDIAHKTADACDQLREEHPDPLFDAIRYHADRLKQRKPGIVKTVEFAVIRGAFAKLDERLRRLPNILGHPVKKRDFPLENFNSAVAELFKTRRRDVTYRRDRDAVAALNRNLGIPRIVTLNYDFELERALMLTSDEQQEVAKGEHVGEPFTFLKMTGKPKTGRPIALLERSTLRRRMPDGLTVKSDILNRERVDRLFEFAIASTKQDRHILHLHGRADRTESMVFDIRDYDQLYRLDDLYRNPFQHGLRVLFAGNPVLFVGIGMSEQEINDTLQYFVSNSPYRRAAPAFVIWNTIKPRQSNIQSYEDEASRIHRSIMMGEEEKRLAFEVLLQRLITEAESEMRERRIDFIERLGVHVLFDIDLFGGGHNAVRALNVLRLEYLEQLGRCPHPLASDDTKHAYKQQLRAIELKALAETLDKIPAGVWHQHGLALRQGDAWRLLSKKMSDKGGEPCRLWGTIELRGEAQALKRAGTEPSLQDRLSMRVLSDPSSISSEAEARPAPNAYRAATAPWPTLRPQQPASLSTSHAVASVKWGVPQPRAMVLVARPGSGRGLLAEELIDHDERELKIGSATLILPTNKGNRLLVNAGFAYDSDATMNNIAEFLRLRCKDYQRNTLKVDRKHFFESGAAFQIDEQSLIIINGVDRFFATDGSPLCAEFDHMLRAITDPNLHGEKLQWLLLGSERVGRYFRALSIPVQVYQPKDEKSWLGSRYLTHVKHCVERELASPRAKDAIAAADFGRMAEARHTDANAFRRAFYGAYYNDEILSGIGCDVDLSNAVLRSLAFIGSPVPAHVLLFTPAVRRRLGPKDMRKKRLSDELERLQRAGFLIQVMAYEPDQPVDALRRRFTLHRSLVTELRERHGAPMSEGKLSTAFNLSLFAAQPGESYVPRPDFHRELGELVDRLIGAWKDLEDEGGFQPGTQASQDAFIGARDAVVAAHVEHFGDLRDQFGFHPAGRSAAVEHQQFGWLSTDVATDCLRAALAVLRGYFSTGHLLTLSPDHHAQSARPQGALTDHAERMDRLLSGFGRIAEAREVARRIAGDQRTTDPANHLEPFYADDIVWLHNERGVAKMAQGCLYDANRSFTLALRINEKDLETSGPGQNWRRISLNLVGLLIERGRLNRAEALVEEIEYQIDRRGNPNLSTDILTKFGTQDTYLDGCLSRDFAREDILSVGLTTAYRGLISHLRGRYRDARERYTHGISILRRLGELRAYSIFQRHLAELLLFTRDEKECLEQIKLAIGAAGSVQQLDMLHRAKILHASAVLRRSNDRAESREALQNLMAALTYAQRTDSYRVRVEASAALAREMRRSGDYDTALQYASDALAIASLYGHSLHKVSLRVEIGQILMQRGDPISGAQMIENASRSAVKLGYELTIDRIQRVWADQHGFGEDL